MVIELIIPTSICTIFVSAMLIERQLNDNNDTTIVTINPLEFLIVLIVVRHEAPLLPVKGRFSLGKAEPKHPIPSHWTQGGNKLS